MRELIVHTGQHYDANMSDIFFDEMKIPKPDFYLGVGGKTHGAMTGEMMSKIEQIALDEKPDFVLVYGDTDSTLAGALVATKLHIPLAHVEAGLRSYNMRMPEEINRILTDRVSNILFCPTATAISNLKKEGFAFATPGFKQELCETGDIMAEGAKFYRQFARKPALDLPSEFALCTVHRAENTDDPARLKSIFAALGEISSETPVVLPLHPRTRKIISNLNIAVPSGVRLIEPVGHLEMIWLIDNSNLILTDSGGLQKEAYFFAKNCIVLREETEWVELTDARFNAVAGWEAEKILNIYRNFKFNQDFSANLYGNGETSAKIAEKLREFK